MKHQKVQNNQHTILKEKSRIWTSQGYNRKKYTNKWHMALMETFTKISGKQ